MGNIYHVLARRPALEKEEMFLEAEALAERLVNSGLFRVDAQDKMNFVRWYDPHRNISLNFSHRQLHDPKLIQATQEDIRRALSKHIRGKHELAQAAQFEFFRLRELIARYHPVDSDIEMRLARLLLQSIEPVVVALVLIERVEVFISFSHSIGDMLDIQNWQSMGQNSGMQSTSLQKCAVFVSCGGHPFLHNRDQNEYIGDGEPAISRLMVIAGQEFGHYSDLIRNKQGEIIGRHSTNNYGSEASKSVKLARLKDIENLQLLEKRFKSWGLSECTSKEHYVRFYLKHRKRGLVYYNAKRKMKQAQHSFIKKCKKNGFGFIKHLTKSGEIGSPLAMCIADMKFNLAPDAEVYKRKNPAEEEMIQCVEALARVPQQVVKWGHMGTKHLMPELYKIYYGQVIPKCLESFKDLTGKEFPLKLTQHPLYWWGRLKRWYKTDTDQYLEEEGEHD